jgi:hypothetical protein
MTQPNYNKANPFVRIEKVKGSWMDRHGSLIVIILSILVYAGALLYALLRATDLVSKTFDPSMVAWGQVAIAALGLSMLALPLSLKYYIKGTAQRRIAIGLYILEALITVGNAVLDVWFSISLINGGGLETIPGGLKYYLFYGFPATPILVAAGWALIWMYDPSSKEQRNRLDMEATARETMQKMIMDNLLSSDVQEALKLGSATMARQTIAELLGVQYADLEIAAQLMTNNQQVDEDRPVTMRELERLLSAGREPLALPEPVQTDIQPVEKQEQQQPTPGPAMRPEIDRQSAAAIPQTGVIPAARPGGDGTSSPLSPDVKA